MSGALPGLYEFGPFLIDKRRRLLRRGDETVAITPKAFDVLTLLVANHGQIVEKGTILEAVWPQTSVEEGNLTVNISLLRRLLGDSRSEHRYIVTVPGRGYQFVAPVRLLDEDAEAEAAHVPAGVPVPLPEGDATPVSGAASHWLHAAGRTMTRSGRRLMLGSAIAVGCLLPLLIYAPNANETEMAEDAEARSLYLRGRFFLSRRTDEGLVRGQRYFEQAIERSPRFASAYAGLADAHSMQAYFGMVPPAEGRPKAISAARRALELDSGSAEAHTSLAYIQHRFEWNWTAAERSFRRAIASDPDYALARHWYASFLNAMGRREEAIAQALHAETLDPLTPVITANLDTMLRLDRPGLPLERSQGILEMDPNCWLAHWTVGETLRAKGLHSDAIKEYERAAELANRSLFLLSRLGTAYAVTGRTADARAVLREIDALALRHYVSAYTRVPVLAALGDHDAAFDWLERAFDERSSHLPFLSVSLSSLQSDPRFADLVSRVGLR
jgi:DNA-binding winged helix-turn-helix (wHTH) protein/tetratricopeptide (TPR) repeat protein